MYDPYKITPKPKKKPWTREQEAKTPAVCDNRPWWACILGSPHFYIPDHREHGKSLACDYPSHPNENSEEYWIRVKREILFKNMSFEYGPKKASQQ